MFATFWDFSTVESACLTLVFGCFVGATALQLAVWGFVFTKFWKTTPSPKPDFSGIHPDLAPFPPVSIVICARNEANNLKHKLHTILNQQYPGVFEVIVVDDASNDDSPAVLLEYGLQYPQLRLLRLNDKKTPGKKEALARGIATARYEWLLLTDADCQPVGPHWITAMMQSTRTCPGVEIILGYAPMLPARGCLQAWARYEVAYTALQYVAFAQMGWPYMGVGRNLAWKKTLFATSDGFKGHADLASGDDDLFVNAVASAANTKVCLDPKAVVYSTAKQSWAGWRRQKQRHLSAGGRYRLGHRLMLGAIALTQTLHYGLGALLLLYQERVAGVLLLYDIRILCVASVYVRSFRLLRENQLLPLILLWDGLLAVYYGAFVPFALWFRRKQVDWDS